MEMEMSSRDVNVGAVEQLAGPGPQASARAVKSGEWMGKAKAKQKGKSGSGWQRKVKEIA